MTERIMDYLMDKKARTDNKCGTYPTTLSKALSTPYSELRQPLNQLYKEQKIVLRDGAQGRLIFIKENDREV